MSDLAASYFEDEKFAPVRPLLVDYLPGISRADMACAFIGELMRHVPRGCPESHWHVLMILLGHAGYHSNRVWASQWRIAEIGIAKFGWKGTPEQHLKTVGRAEAFWCTKFPILRKITDQEELLRGPGEHWFVDKGNKKRGHGQTNHFDTSGLKAYPPKAFCGALDALITGEQYTPPKQPEPMQEIDLDERYPYPFADDEELVESRARAVARQATSQKRSVEACAVAIQQGNDESTAEGFEDPFAEASVPSKNAVSTGQASKSGIPHVVDKKDISNISTTPENVEMSDKYDKASRPEKPATGPVANTRFNPSKMSDVTIRYSAPACPPAKIPPGAQKNKRANPANYTPEVAELTRRGVGEGMAVTMFKTMRTKLGDADAARRWLRQFLAYGKHRDAEDNEIHEGGWYNRTYEKWRDGEANSWPDEAMDAIGRAEAAYNKSVWGRLSQSPPSREPQQPNQAPFPLIGGTMDVPERFSVGGPQTPALAPDPVPAHEAELFGEPSPELKAVWPAVLREAETCFNKGFYLTHVLPLCAGTLTVRNEGVLATAITLSQFTASTFDDKPQHLGMLARLLATELGIAPRTLTLKIVLTPGPIRGRSV